MAPVLEMAMVAKLLMILIDSPMMWDVPSCTTGRRSYIARILKNFHNFQVLALRLLLIVLDILDSQKTHLKISYSSCIAKAVWTQ